MALERRPEPQRPSLWTLVLPAAAIIIGIFVVLALLNTILWFAKIGIVLVLLVLFGVFIGRMSAKNR